MALAGTRAQDPAVAEQVETGRRHQGRKLRGELLGLEDAMPRPVAPAVLEVVEKPPVHGGLVRITGRAPDRLRFELGLREGEPPLMVYASGDRLVR